MPKKTKKVEKVLTDYSQTTFLIERYYQIQEHRIALYSQVRALEKAGEKHDFVLGYAQQFEVMEKQLTKDIKNEVKNHPIFAWMKAQKGIGPILAASLIANIDIHKAEHISSVWKYCGQGVDLETGKADRRTKGKKISWNPFLKMTCWKIGESFVKVKGKYRTIYDTSKVFYQNKFPKEVKEGSRTLYTKGHIHAMSKRRAVKMFLSDMWLEWRKIEGLPISAPFMHRGDENFKFHDGTKPNV